ncbi:hypothetical protein CLV24_11450 [Pontibacter ummariensis]|uniref:Uncharacterized protein n=1 Tax=Pontibacter ummariensis TaxID=1610492 RepID=A0A239HMX6_9BACT|nr:hypothetical protein [Pontibacter ummariensis]PRY10322.1 hypothetical protein CLV24_11450 [Pontibacter ummariensis]SNS82203.1 hypothetical protein SAMN06296052_11450 [Pontibacter ummariensis]
MNTQTQQQPKTVRQMMPPNYLPELVKRTGMATNTIYRAVKYEQKNSKAWPHILKLIKEYQEQQEEEKRLLSAS